jgi:hypothetical protein
VKEEEEEGNEMISHCLIPLYLQCLPTIISSHPFFFFSLSLILTASLVISQIVHRKRHTLFILIILDVVDENEELRAPVDVSVREETERNENAFFGVYFDLRLFEG